MRKKSVGDGIDGANQKKCLSVVSPALIAKIGNVLTNGI